MAIHKEKNNFEKTRFILSPYQIDIIENEIKKFNSLNEFLVKHKVISLNDKGQISIRSFEGLGMSGKEVLPKLNIQYTTDYPYDFWNEALTQLAERKDRIKYAKEMEAMRLEKSILESNITINEEQIIL